MEMEKIKNWFSKHKVLGVVIIGVFVIMIFGSLGSKSDSDNKEKVKSKNEVIVIDFSEMSYNDIALWCEENKVACYKKEAYSDTVSKDSFVSQSIKDGEKIYEGKEINIVYSLGKEPSTEYKNALKKAESYSNIMHMSKQGIYDQLTSEYGEKFQEDAAQYAVDNMVADWNANALAKAKSYQQTMSMSKSAIYDQLISQYGEKFTEEQAQYAIDHLDD